MMCPLQLSHCTSENESSLLAPARTGAGGSIKVKVGKNRRVKKTWGSRSCENHHNPQGVSASLGAIMGLPRWEVITLATKKGTRRANGETEALPREVARPRSLSKLEAEGTTDFKSFCNSRP